MSAKPPGQEESKKQGIASTVAEEVGFSLAMNTPLLASIFIGMAAGALGGYWVGSTFFGLLIMLLLIPAGVVVGAIIGALVYGLIRLLPISFLFD